LDWQEVKLFGQTARRRVVHLGMNYDYTNRQISPTIAPPDFLNELLLRGAQLINRSKADIAEVLITEYSIGAGINWHRDAPVFKDIIGISLGSPTLIHFRKRSNKKEQIKLNLDPGSAYVLSGSIRWEWEHRIAPVKSQRYSITLRTLNP
jgi:alkylated DNA repair protein (DNA oxidative demethylase)